MEHEQNARSERAARAEKKVRLGEIIESVRKHTADNAVKSAQQLTAQAQAAAEKSAADVAKLVDVLTAKEKALDAKQATLDAAIAKLNAPPAAPEAPPAP